MKNLFEIKTNGVTYAVRDANTYRSLSDAQATTLLDRAIYNGELVTSGEIFTCADGTMKQFTYDTVMGGDETFNPSDVGATGVFRLFGVFKDNIYIFRQQNYRKYLCISSNKGASFTSTESDSYNRFLKTDDFALIFYAGNDLSSTTFLKTTDGTNFTQVTPVVDGSYSTSEYKGFLSSSLYAYLVDTSSNQTDNKYAWTSDGVNWKVATYPDPSNPAAQNVYWKAVYIFKDKLHVAYGTIYGEGGLFRLDDVENGTWTELTPSTTIYSNSVTAAGNYLYIIDNGTATYYSTDGYTFNSTSDWSEKPQGRVFYCKDTGVYVSVYRYSYGVTYKTSTNGTTWSSSSSAPSANNDPQGDTGTDFVFLYCDIMGTKKLFRIDTGVSIVDKTLTALSYNKDEVDALITGGTTLDDIATAGDGIKFVEAGSKTQNFTLHGSPTIVDGVASDFSSNNYIIPDYTFEPNSDPWKIKFKFTPTSSNNCSIVGSEYDTLQRETILFRIVSGWHMMIIFFDTSGNQVVFNTGSYTFSSGTTYYAEIGYDGTKYYSKYSTDGTSWTDDMNVTSSTPMSNGKFIIGTTKHSGGSGEYFVGSVDLNEFSTEINDVVVWTPYTVSPDTKPAITVDIGSGDSAPTSSTEGYVGKLYITSGGAVYICTGVSGSTYTWSQITVS